MKSAGQLYDVLIEGISRFFKEAGKKKAVLGLSGGLDSAVVACLAQDALGKNNVHSLLMPGPYSTIHSITDALKSCSLNELSHHIVPIDAIYHKALRELSSVMEHTNFDVTEENVQARLRAVFLMAYANKHNTLLLCTSNKSELAMGYGTLYGDLAGALMVLGDVYK
ncbi:MAG: NAD(+) synthase, partial [Chloroflexi bacterium]|nr:NAD(+) synthase [Chloroflexota bacterium]